jgi:hypothetical protein
VSSTRIFLEQIDQSGASGNHLMYWNGSTWTAGPLPTGSVALSSLANLGANTILGNNTGSSAAPVGLTGSQVTAILTGMVGATVSVAGSKGLVPAPAAGDQTKFLRGDGLWAAAAGSTTWGNITGTLSNQADLSSAFAGKLDTSHAGSGGSAHALVISGGLAGFMTGSDKAKLDGVASGATANSTDAVLLDRANHTGTESITTNTFSATSRFAGRITAGSGVAEELTGTQATTLLDTATQSLKGLLSSTDKTKLDGVASGATANSPDSTLLNRANHTGTQAVTTISFTTTSRFLGRATAGSGTGEELTGTQATALLDVATGTLKGLMSSSDFTKLSGIAAGATANNTDAYLLNRANHTGTQAWSTITSTPTTVAGYGITDAVATGLLGAANGIATLDSNSKIPVGQLPAIAVTSVYVVANQTAQLALSVQEGDLAVRTDQSKTYINNGGTAGTMADWTELLSPTGGVTSVNGLIGTVVLTKTDIGLGNVDNTADTDKPVSSPQQTALDLKLNATHAGTGGSAHAVVVAGGAAGFITGTDKSKLDGIATGATANSTDAFLLARANHTGTQAITTNTFTATGKIAGRITTGAGIVEELTGSQVTSLLDLFGTSKGLVPGTASDTTKFLRADGTWIAPPNTGVWGSITGTLSAQTDLQAALDGKLSFLDGGGPGLWATGEWRIQPPAGSIVVEGALTGGSGAQFQLDASNSTSETGILWGSNTSWSHWWGIGDKSANTRYLIYGDRAFEFSATPYVGTYGIYHAGNKPTKADVGLGNVDNTSDADKPVSTAQQSALDAKANLSGGNSFVGTQSVSGNVGINTTAGSLALAVHGTAASGAAVIRLSAPVNASKYGFSEVRLSLNNPLVTASPNTPVFSFGAEGTYSDAGAVTNQDFYIYDAQAGQYRLYVAGDGTVKIGGTDAQTAQGLTIATSGNVTVAGTIGASNLSGTNTGDETNTTILTKIGATGGSGFLKQDGTWQSVGGSGFNVSATGTGSSQNITVPIALTASTDVLVFVNGLQQRPDTDYTVSGTTVTITTSSGDAIYIVKPSGSQGPAGTNGSGSWGTISGTLSAQTDLQAALDGKLTWIDNHVAYGPNAVRIPGTYSAISSGDITVTSMATINSGTSGANDGAGISIDLQNFAGGGWMGGLTANSRFQIQTYGTVTGWEFNTAPYVGTNVIYHAGNLTKTTLGLANVDNTSDVSKPISTATQAALDDRLVISRFHNVQFDATSGKYNFLEIGGAGGGIVSMGADDTGTGWPYFSFANATNTDWAVFGTLTTNGRVGINGSKAWEFASNPYVGTNAIYHAGNLTLSTLGGLPLTGGTLSGPITVSGASGTSSQIFGGGATFQAGGSFYTDLIFKDGNGAVRANIYGGTATDHIFYLEGEQIQLLNLAETIVYLNATSSGVDLKASNTTRLSVSSSGAAVTGVISVDQGNVANSAVITLNNLGAGFGSAIQFNLAAGGSLNIGDNSGSAGFVQASSNRSQVFNAYNNAFDASTQAFLFNNFDCDARTVMRLKQGNSTATAGFIDFVNYNNVSKFSVSLAGNVLASGTVTGSNLSGTNTGDQTITLTGPVTGSGTGSFATSITANAITDAMLAQVATATFKGRISAGTGNPEVLTAAQATSLLSPVVAGGAQGVMTGSDKTKLDAITGTNTGDQTITLTGDVTGSGTGSFAATIGANKVTLAQMAQVATGTVFYRKTAATGNPEVQTLATLKTDLGLTGTNSGDQTITLTGDVTGTGTGSFAATIGANKVTLAQMAQVATGYLPWPHNCGHRQRRSTHWRAGYRAALNRGRWWRTGRDDRRRQDQAGRHCYWCNGEHRYGYCGKCRHCKRRFGYKLRRRNTCTDNHARCNHPKQCCIHWRSQRYNGRFQ